jgi:Cu(I)/Ag(I) efflux system membrane protein CusA/SilA
MRRIAAPMVGGMVSSTVLTLLVIPALYALIKGWKLPREAVARSGAKNLSPRSHPAE